MTLPDIQMTGNDAQATAVAQIVETAERMRDGELNMIEGARRIVELSWKAGLHGDKDIIPFICIDSETDALPLGDVRRQWRQDALEKLQPEIERAEAWARKFGLPACVSLIERLTRR